LEEWPEHEEAAMLLLLTALSLCLEHTKQKLAIS
jgi:hypothetical protein